VCVCACLLGDQLCDQSKQRPEEEGGGGGQEFLTSCIAARKLHHRSPELHAGEKDVCVCVCVCV